MTLVEKIADFVNGTNKPDWWRFALNKAIEQDSQLDLSIIYNVAKMEYGLDIKSKEYELLTKIVRPIGYENEREEHKLISISNVQNISSLASNQSLEFALDGLTVIYGNNGTGKSSYARLMKNACLSRGSTPKLLSNIFTSNSGVPSAQIQIESNGTSETINWSNVFPSDPRLKSIRVFDSTSASHYLSKSETLNYKPSALKLLDELVSACTFIANETRKDESKVAALPVLPPMCDGTLASNLKISSKLTLEEVESHCANDSEIDELKDLEKEITELTSSSPAQLRERLKLKIERYVSLKTFLRDLVNHLDGDAIYTIKSSYERYLEAYTAADILSETTFSELPLSNIGSSEWGSMWTAVKAFVESLDTPTDFPPKAGNYCPTCLQKIDNPTAERFAKLDRFIKSELQKQAKLAETVWVTNRQNISWLNLNTTPYDSTLNEIKGRNEELSFLFESLLSNLKNRANNVTSATPEPVFDTTELDIEALTRLEIHINKLNEKEQSIADDISLNLKINEMQKRYFEIQDRIKIRNAKDDIINEINKAKKRDILNSIRVSTSTTSITRLINEITNSSAVGLIQDLFDEELKKLGFKHFGLKTITRGIRGAQTFSLEMPVKNANILDIASEGEQKCIAMAGFFAELATDSRKSAIIFDDPVTSLDHLWREKFAKRIAKESETRQVIVLSHDLAFIKLLEEASPDLTIKAITRNHLMTGITRKSPPWDSLKTEERIKVLKNELSKIQSDLDVDYENYQEKAKRIYGLMRETWERLIEEWLIRQVVERFGRSVKAQNTRYLVGITIEDIQTITSAHGKCSTYIDGHDMAINMAGCCPDPDEISQDINHLESYFRDLRKIRNKQ